MTRPEQAGQAQRAQGPQTCPPHGGGAVGEPGPGAVQAGPRPEGERGGGGVSLCFRPRVCGAPSPPVASRGGQAGSSGSARWGLPALRAAPATLCAPGPATRPCGHDPIRSPTSPPRIPRSCQPAAPRKQEGVRGGGAGRKCRKWPPGAALILGRSRGPLASRPAQPGGDAGRDLRTAPAPLAGSPGHLTPRCAGHKRAVAGGEETMSGLRQARLSPPRWEPRGLTTSGPQAQAPRGARRGFRRAGPTAQR